MSETQPLRKLDLHSEPKSPPKHYLNRTIKFLIGVLLIFASIGLMKYSKEEMSDVDTYCGNVKNNITNNFKNDTSTEFYYPLADYIMYEFTGLDFGLMGIVLIYISLSSYNLRCINISRPEDVFGKNYLDIGVYAWIFGSTMYSFIIFRWGVELY